MPAKKSKSGVIVPDRRHYGTERVTTDPIHDDTQEAPMKAPEKVLRRFERGFETVKMPEHKPAHSSSDGDKVGKPWVLPARRK